MYTFGLITTVVPMRMIKNVERQLPCGIVVIDWCGFSVRSSYPIPAPAVLEWVLYDIVNFVTAADAE